MDLNNVFIKKPALHIFLDVIMGRYLLIIQSVLKINGNYFTAVLYRLAQKDLVVVFL